MQRRVWCYPGRLSDGIRVAARDAGATELVSGVPPRLADHVDASALGDVGVLVVIDVPDPVIEPDPLDAIRAAIANLRDRLRALEGG